MTIIRTLCLLIFCLLCCQSFAQHPLDRFSVGSIPTTIGTSTDKLINPVDLDFCRIPGRQHELWVLNQESSTMGSMTIFFHAGTPTQVSQYRKDSHNEHFMIKPSAFAMADNGDFATTQEVQNSVGNQVSDFMGPALWMSDTSVYARIHQSNWDPTKPLGSHIDMLHQSPFGMGIAYEQERIYWVFDGYHGNLCRYDFAEPHEIGGDDHSDGAIWRYPEVELTRVPNLPAHMVYDPVTHWLYIVDNANKRVIRVNTETGMEAGELFAATEPLALYMEMKNVVQEVFIDTGLVKPCGIDYWNGRLVVTDNANGDIRIYDATGAKGQLITTIKTGAAGIMGVKIGPDSNIWYVNRTTNRVFRLEPVAAPVSVALVAPANNAANVTRPVNLSWQIQNGSFDSVRVQVTEGLATVTDVTLLAAVTQHTLSSLAEGKQYKWKVGGINTGEQIVWSSEWSFTTEVKAPVVPVLISPADLSVGIADTVTLVWNASEGAEYYQVQLSKQSDFSSLDLDNDSTVATSQLVSSLSAGVKYYWRVRAFNELTNSNWSQAWSFTTGTASVYDEQHNATVSIYPNPMNATTTIVYTAPVVGEVQYELVNILGVTLRSGSFGSVTLVLDRTDLPAGSYVLKLRTGSESLTRTLLITE